MTVETFATLLVLGYGLWVVVGLRRRRSPLADRSGRPHRITPVRVLALVPAGAAALTVVGGDLPLTIVVAVGALLAVAHRAMPAPFEVVAGLGAAAAAVWQAAAGTDCREPVGIVGLAIMAGVGLVALTLLAAAASMDGGLRGVGLGAVASAAIIELVVFAISPVGGTIIGYVPDLWVTVAIGLAVVVAFGLGRAPEVGLAALGLGLLAAQLILAGESGGCGVGALTTAVGAVAFGLVGAALAPSSPARRPRTRTPARVTY